MSDLIIALNGFGEAWGSAIWRASWHGAIAVVVAWTACRLLPRLSPQVRVWLWRLAFLKLLLGLVPLRPIHLPVLPASSAGTSVFPQAPLTEFVPARIAAVASAPPAIGAEIVLPALATVLLGIWLVGVLWYEVRMAQSRRMVQRLLMDCEPLRDQDLSDAIQELCQRSGVRRPPTVLVGEGAGPLLLGIRRPVVVLPRALLASCDRSEMWLMLAHEVAHLRRRDLVWNWIPLFAQMLFFFHPLVWLGRREWMVSQEMACDALALEITSGDDAEYGRMLVKFAAEHGGHREQLITVGIAESTQNLRRRLVAMAHATRLTRRRLVLVGLSVGVLAVAVLVPWRPSARPALGLAAGTAWAQGGGGAVGGGMRGPVEETPSDAGLTEVESLPGVWTAGGFETGPLPITGSLLVSSSRKVAGTSETYSFLVRNRSDEITSAPAFLIDADLSPVWDTVAYDQALSDEWPPSTRDIGTCWIDGSGRTNLTERAGLGGVNCVPCWSPDGKKIAFQHSEPEPGEKPCDAGFQIWVVSADGTGARQVIPEGVELPMLRYVRWSPDGTRLSCGAHNRDAVMNVDGSGVSVFYETRGGPDWSPDGRRLVSSGFAYSRLDGEMGVWRRLVVTDPDGANPRTLVQQFVRLADIETHVMRLESEGEGPIDRSDVRWSVGPYFPRWSPDGNQIAFLAAMPFDPDGVSYRQQQEVWLYDLPGGTLSRITRDDNNDNWLSWR